MLNYTMGRGHIVIILGIISVSMITIAYSESTTFSLGKPMYLDGEVITISGIVSDFKTYPVSIEIVDPTGDSINTIPTVPNYWSEFDLSVETGGLIWKNDGVYTVVVTHASIPESRITTFEYFHSDPSPKPHNAGPLGEEHAQAKLSVQVYGNFFNFTEPRFQMVSPWIRFEDGETIHRYASGVPLGFLFNTLGRSGNNDECYRFQGGSVYCTNAYFTYKFLINGQHVSETDLRKYVVQDGDEIQIIYDDQFITETSKIIPDWIKNVAGFWCIDAIDDASFVGAIQFLLENQIIVIPKTYQDEGTPIMPYWIKNNACWWSTNQISDDDFASGIEFMIKNGIIHV